MSAKNRDSQGRWRNKTVAFRVSPEEDKLIETLVRLSGLTKQEYIVRRLQEKEIVVVGNPRVYKALTKETIYPIVKSTAKWFGVKMTKEVFTGFFKHAIPVVGGVIGGGLSYMSFKPCCDKLKVSLQDTLLSNLAYEVTTEENAFDVEEEEIVEYSEDVEE